MEGRIVAIRVSDADFEVLEGLKKKEDIGWNQLLLVPLETVYNVTLETARPVKKEKKAEPPKAEKPKKKGGKKAEAVVELPAASEEIVPTPEE